MKIPVGVLGATGMVGQRFVTLLANHPWFELVVLAASPQSAGKTYAAAVAGRWVYDEPIPQAIENLTVYSIEDDKKTIAAMVRVVFCAIDLDKQTIQSIEEAYAALGVAVVSNNSAHRWTADIPMLIPEVNPQHLEMIDIQRKNRSWSKGLIVTKPNCSIQCYVPLLQAWRQFEPEAVIVSTYQAISGAGKTFATWPEMVDNVIPYIGEEEKKSETEPQKIWADIQAGQFVLSDKPKISANCIRVPVSNGHLTAINVRFGQSATPSQLIEAITQFDNPLADLNLPSAPQPFLQYCAEDNRPQTKLDRDWQQGMGVSVGRLREDTILGWKCVALSHNTIRGAAGGAILVAELLQAKGYL